MKGLYVPSSSSAYDVSSSARSQSSHLLGVEVDGHDDHLIGVSVDTVGERQVGESFLFLVYDFYLILFPGNLFHIHFCNIFSTMFSNFYRLLTCLQIYKNEILPVLHMFLCLCCFL